VGVQRDTDVIFGQRSKRRSLPCGIGADKNNTGIRRAGRSVNVQDGQCAVEAEI
jgi:hypothetical protein